MDNNRKVLVRNRSNSVVIYHVDDMGVRREFAPGETKLVPLPEIYALSQKQSGLYQLRNNLFIQDTAAIQEMQMHVEPEYFLDEAGVRELLKNGSVDELIDCLNFAPKGVIELLKKQALELPLNDLQKINVIKEKLDFDVIGALRHRQEVEEALAEESETTSSGMKVQQAPTRLVQKGAPAEAESAPAETGRRTTPKYKVVSTSN